MKKLRKLSIVAALLSFIAVASSADIMAQTKKKPVLRKRTTARKVVKPAVRLYAVPRGERIRARMEGTISSKTARAGDTFQARVTEDVRSSNGVLVIPSGSKVIGRVDSAVPA